MNNLQTYEKKSNNPKACIIWMHGLGSDAQNMLGVAEAFPNDLAVTHISVNAPIRPVTINNNMQMRAWYDILGTKLTDREDKQGITQSASLISEIIQQQIANGYKANQIFLAGFSQGGAMALYTGLTSELELGGIISLSAYIPLVASLSNLKYKYTPIFIGLGEYDQIVLPGWTDASYNWLITEKFTDVSIHRYPIEHNICIEEIRDLYNWLNLHISRKTVMEKI